MTESIKRYPSPTPYPFSEAVKVGNLLYLSGQIGFDPATKRLADGGAGPETTQTMENIKATLERTGSSLSRIIRCEVMLADMTEFNDMNAAYAAFFDKPDYPARSAFGVSGLALGARVEIQVLALVDD